ncbi:hypothetical protein [Sodaliphilus sp.]|uniref:hypothetical protein n=1 Tax=Sodaliphilus sp. TaxID=2815818 RepID=UPI00388F0316
MKDNSATYQRLFFFIFWVGATFGFISDEVITGLASMRTPVFLMLDALWVLLACCTVRNKWHIACMACFIAVSCATTCLSNGMPLTFWANGVRDILGIFLAYPILCYFMQEPARRERFENSLDRHLMCFLGVQAFCVTYQCLLYGAGDHCGGSFGNWYSGIVSMCIYCASFYLMHRSIDQSHFFASLRSNWLPVVLLFPTFLNETKVSFVLIVLYFVLLMPLDRRYLVRAMWILPVGLLLGWMAIAVYTSTVKDFDDIFSMEFVTDYIMIDDIEDAEGGAMWDLEEGNKADVPRLTKIMYLPLLHNEEPGHELTGWGVGQFKGGSMFGVSEFAERYDWLLMGSIPYMFHVHIQLGQVGLVMCVLWLLALFVVKPAWSSGRNFNMQLFALVCILIIMIYNDSLRDLWMCSFIFLLMAASWHNENNEVEAGETELPLSQEQQQ